MSDAKDAGAAPSMGLAPGFARCLVGVLVATGLLVRVLPLVQGADLLVRQPTEDGFLMLTVARNMAVGLGMSTAAGKIPTNGVQPLSTFLDAACFHLVHGDRVAGIGLVMALSAVISVLALVAVYRLARVVLADRADGPQMSAVAAALWFASPLVAEHSTNGLETGLYLLVVALTLRCYLVRAVDPARDMNRREVVVLGLLLGLAFWARNDAIFLIAALGAARVVSSLRLGTQVVRRRVLEAVGFGALAGTVASPWMVYNFVNFGSIVPVSGRAEATRTFAPALPFLPARLFEYVTITGDLPNAIESRPAVQALSVAVILVAAWLAVRGCRRGAPARRAACLVALLLAALLAGFYGLSFGAPHFLSRYLSPLSIPFAVGVAALVSWDWVARRRVVATAAFAGLGAVAVAAGVFRYTQRWDHRHFQVVDWVRRNVADDVWVGAIQTGTLGFFHDRTVNLDGKTNPEALKVKGDRALMREYILRSEIRYLVDWEGILGWSEMLAPEFKVRLHAGKDLAVLERVR